MKIDYLKIDEYKNLKGFEIDFNVNFPTTVIVGANGTGKSNLIEAIVLIFRNLDLGVLPAFSYFIKYTCYGNEIEVKTNVLNGHTYATVNGKALRGKISPLKRPKDGASNYLPAHIFGYYSGQSQRLEELFDRHQQRFYEELIDEKHHTKDSKKHKDGDWLRPLFYARPEHSQFVLLAFLLDKKGAGMEFLKSHLNIESFDSALFIMRKPFAWESKSGGDKRFWNAGGAVQPLLSKLYDISLAPIRRDDPIKISFRQTLMRQHLYLFLPNIKVLRSLASNYKSSRNFFKALESTFISDLIKEVRIKVKIKQSDNTITFRELSEGEQQLLTVLGLLLFTKEEESLFLLDEPDTHLNTRWSVGYMELLDGIVRTSDSSQVILTTHNPLVVSSLKKEQVHIFQWDEAHAKSVAQTPDDDPRGMGISGLLMSDMFGLRSSLDLPTMRLLDEKRDLASKSALTDAEKDRLDSLNEELGQIGNMTSVRDPLYKLFVDSGFVNGSTAFQAGWVW